jgi:hypothetical protein
VIELQDVNLHAANTLTAKLSVSAIGTLVTGTLEVTHFEKCDIYPKTDQLLIFAVLEPLILRGSAATTVTEEMLVG